MTLEILYEEMSNHTKDECANCRVPHSCCSVEYCEMTIDWAQSQWEVELKRTDHPTLPLMSKEGCIAAPHLRPICTVHVCSINSFGCKPNDPEWNKKYWNLRTQIEERELDRDCK